MKEFKICTLIEENGKLINVSEKIQKKLFELGYKWYEKNNTVQYTERPFLYVDSNGFITCDKIRSIEYFVKHENELLSYEELMKIEYNFKPFQQVLVRDSENHIWKPEIFSCFIEGRDSQLKYRTVGGVFWIYCIPYTGNEHLENTTKNPNDE